MYPVTKEELVETIGKLKNKHSYGVDGIPDFIVKHSVHMILEPMLDICNLSFATGYFPDPFKIAKIKPIFKKGKKDNIENYRPISLLPVFSKILEKMMYNRLVPVPFLQKHNILSTSQFGFRKDMSINNAIFSFTNNILNAKDSKEHVLGLFIDLKKAFDVVDHDILIEKLEGYGIRGVANNWFKSYLKNRSHLVEIEAVHSIPLPIYYGVPQGSILGPVLFLIYINDLPLCIPHADTVRYFLQMIQI